MTTHSRTVPGDIIRAFRRVTRFTQKALSEQLGLPLKTLISYERDGAPEAIRYALLGLGLAEQSATKQDLLRLLAIPQMAGPVRLDYGSESQEPESATSG